MIIFVHESTSFPILVNDDVRRLDFRYEKGEKCIHIATFNASGELEFERDFPVR